MYLAQITAGSNKEILENKVKPPLKFLNFLGEKCDLIVAPGSNISSEYAVGFNLITNNNIISGPNTTEKMSPLSEIYENVVTNGNHSTASPNKNKLNQRLSNITNTNSYASTYQSSSKERIQKIVADSQRSQIDTVYNENYKFTIHVSGFEKSKLSMKNDGDFLFKLEDEMKNSQVQNGMIFSKLVTFLIVAISF
jgi:hypothetical protein